MLTALGVLTGCACDGTGCCCAAMAYCWGCAGAGLWAWVCCCCTCCCLASCACCCIFLVFIPMFTASCCRRCFSVVVSLYSSKDFADRYSDSSNRFAICGNFLSHSCGAFGFRCCNKWTLVHGIRVRMISDTSNKTSASRSIKLALTF